MNQVANQSKTLSCFKLNKNIFSNIDIKNKELTKSILLSQIDQGKPIAIFAYGSLIWRPSEGLNDYVNSTVKGFERLFCLKSRSLRGTPENPGLILGLVESSANNECHGFSYVFNDIMEFEKILVPFLEREHTTTAYVPSWTNADTENHGQIQTLILLNDKDHHKFYDVPKIDEQAIIIKSAVGNKGSNLEYLKFTSKALEKTGIVDPYLNELENQIENI